MNIREAIENLKYLISGDCTDNQMDFVEEITMAIDALEKQTPKQPCVKAEAIKEFAERLKESEGQITTMFLCRGNITTYVPLENIDNLVKEMVGEDK